MIVARHPLIFGLIMMVVLGVAALLGRLAGGTDTEAPAKLALIPVQAAILSLAGLMLGFSFNMALARYEHRRTLVIAEADAISTSYLRAALLPAPYAAPARRLLGRYVGVRLDYLEAGFDRTAIEAAERRSARLQDRLWHVTGQAVAAQANAITGRFVQSMNDMFDLEADSDAALHDTMPAVVWLTLLVVTLGASFYTGLILRSRNRAALMSLPLIFAVVLALIAELDSPRTGFLTVSEHSLQRVAASIAAPASRR